MRTERAEKRTETLITKESWNEWQAEKSKQEKRLNAKKQYLMQCDKCWEEYNRWRNNYHPHDDYLEPLDYSYEDCLLKERQQMLDEEEKIEKEIQSMLEEVYGAIYDFKPECNCSEALMSNAATAVGRKKLFLDNHKSSSRNHYLSKCKANEKAAAKSMPIVASKHKRAPQATLAHDIANKKCGNVSKTAKYRYHSKLTISFPEIVGKHYGKLSIANLISTFNDWAVMARRDKKHELVLACENAIKELDNVGQYHGEITGLHRDDSTLHLTIGFREKLNMSEYIYKKAI